MAHHKATKKAIRQTQTRTLRNRIRKTRFRNAVKKVELAVAEKDKKNAPALLIKAQKELFSAVQKGALKLETASRKFSRLNGKVKALVAGK